MGCAPTGEADTKLMTQIQQDFQKKDIRVRMLDPARRAAMLEELLVDLYKEISWNRSHRDTEQTADVGEDLLGQTVRLKNLETRPELNGRCGVCIGFDRSRVRYRVRILTESGVESELALKES